MEVPILKDDDLIDGSVYDVTILPRETKQAIFHAAIINLLCCQHTESFPAVDQQTSTRRFPLDDHGLFLFSRFEVARRNVALKMWYFAKYELDLLLVVEGRMKKLYAILAGARVQAYSHRAGAYLPRLDYFTKSCREIHLPVQKLPGES